ncbi:type I-E CRISPR-associated protein Cas7/Cse4/CasC [Streptomonospora salina]|uniref:CRISPR system Cascade subunit CasC n=1 Tax=Streptomonospora salina TaxID=104205 RepID=A0A841E7X9_9ACTN|nr:type I-E CRISPR-associated protein Cas7/Cse4/CasC [Streptomonospora salina]MBB6000057.1 CRISPR system Cascade subunit CasC [Streptomonospora salina]
MPNPAYIDIHALQTLPYSNLNRDDLGSPKTLVLGGAERTRVSSQSWKREVRRRVENRLGDPAVRTRRLVSAVTERLRTSGWSEENALEAGKQVVRSAGKDISLGTAKKNHKGETLPPDTSVLLYLPSDAIAQLAELAAEHAEDIAAQAGKKQPKAVLPTDRVVAVLNSRNASVRLFGRMLAELPETELDGAVQFAHAFTVHPTNIDVDFFTAVDDLLKDGDRGSGHMNEGMFSAGTFYRYANLNLTQLVNNSGGDTREAARLAAEFLRAFVDTVPSGKQTATAAVTVPDLVHVAVRSDRPVSYATAFEEPVAGTHGHLATARDRLEAYAGELASVWWPDSILYQGHAGLGLDKDLPSLGANTGSYAALIEQAMQQAAPASADEAAQ